VADEERIREAVRAGYLVRSFAGDADVPADRARQEIEAAARAGAHVISTDHPVEASAQGDYRIDVPGGAPTACNPVTAPPECTAAAL
jgi:hypothetical protein